jgi:iduronate 2-sulfatase
MRHLLFITLLSAATSWAADKPNVLFIAIDDLKPALGCYGDKTALTPEIDRMAARGTVFTKAYCQWPVCGPSRASIMTSLRPEANGVMDLKTNVRAKDANVLTLTQHFIANGYTAAGCGKIYDPRCVDNKKDCDKPSWSLPFITPHAAGEGAGGENGEGHPAYGAPECTDTEQTDGVIAETGLELMRKLAGDKSKPFFLAVGFKKPHLPFIAPKNYWDLYQRDKMPLATYTGGVSNDSGYVLHDSPEFRSYGDMPKEAPIPEAMQRESLHGYYACVSFIDAQIGKLMNLAPRPASTGDWFSSAIRMGDLKLLDFPSEKKVELYDLTTDPSESKNLAESRPEDRDRLLAKLNAWRTEVGASTTPKEKKPKKK